MIKNKPDYKSLIIFLLGIENKKNKKKFEEYGNLIMNNIKKGLYKQKIIKDTEKRSKKNIIEFEVNEHLKLEDMPSGGYTKKEIIKALVFVLRHTIANEVAKEKIRRPRKHGRWLNEQENFRIKKKIRDLKGNLNKRINELKKEGIIKTVAVKEEVLYYLTRKGNKKYNIIRNNMQHYFYLYIYYGDYPKF